MAGAKRLSAEEAVAAGKKLCPVCGGKAGSDTILCGFCVKSTESGKFSLVFDGTFAAANGKDVIVRAASNDRSAYAVKAVTFILQSGTLPEGELLFSAQLPVGYEQGTVKLIPQIPQSATTP